MKLENKIVFGDKQMNRPKTKSRRMSFRTKPHLSRSTSGAALVEGVVALCLITMGTVVAVTLLVNTGMSTYYKEKLGFIANQAAIYAASIPPSEDIVTSTKPVVQDLLLKMGLPASQFKLTGMHTDVAGKPAVSVTIAISALPLFGDGQLLPLSISLQDTAVTMRSTAPQAYLWFNRNPRVSGYLIPVVRVPPDGVSSIGLPCIIP